MLFKTYQCHWLILIIILISNYPANGAQDISDLYQTSIAVIGRSEEERVTAFRAALEEVVNRISGRKINLANINPADLAVRFNYENTDNKLQIFCIGRT